ncbi:MAG: non-canonical purine NTP pyrophosphatase [Phycisphaeraceae bacterium]
MKILLATTNPGKRDEILAVFDRCAAESGGPGPQVELVTLSEVSGEFAEPVEDGPSFEHNALIKARGYAAQSGMTTLADDSGLEVDALGGEPGVRSARYSGVEGPREEVDRANNVHLLAKMSGVPVERRMARFVCAMALVEPMPRAEGRDVSPAGAAAGDDPDVLALVRGTIEGRILLPSEAEDPDQAERGRGSNGFGYDPLFFVPRLGRTTAELPPKEKNAISHRGSASRKLWEKLAAMG